VVHQICGSPTRVLVVRRCLVSQVLREHDLVVHVTNGIRKELPKRFIQEADLIGKRTVEIHSSF
jgi:hypothetical protein